LKVPCPGCNQALIRTTDNFCCNNKKCKQYKKDQFTSYIK